MFKRSASSSNIPRLRGSSSISSTTTPIQDKKDSTGIRQRSKSFLRDSGLDGRFSGLSSRSSSNYNRASRTPQFKNGPQNNVKINEAFFRVQTFIENSGLFDKSIANSGNIRPPSQKVFIYVTQVLFQQIFKKVNLTKDNFKEEILKLLKLVKCPIKVTQNMLKIASHMNSWPTIINLFDWLISIIPPQKLESFSSLDEESIKRTALSELAIEYINSSYELFNGKQVEQEEELSQDVIKRIADIMGFDEEKYKAAKSEINHLKSHRDFLKESVEDKQLKIEDTEQNNIELNKKKADLKLKINEFELDPLDIRLTDRKEKLKKAFEERNRIKNQVLDKKMLIDNQKYSLSDLKSYQQQVEATKKDLQMEKDQFEDLKNIKDELDEKICQQNTYLLEEVKRWNKDVTKNYYNKPEIMNNLVLRQKSFHEPAFLEEVKAVVKQKDEIERHEKCNMEQISELLKQGRRKIKQLQEQVDELQLKDVTLKNDIEQMDELVENCESEILQIKKEWNNQALVNDKDLQEMQTKIQTIQNEVNFQLRPNKILKQKEWEVFQNNAIDFFRNIQKENTKCLQEIEKMRMNMHLNLIEKRKMKLDKGKKLLQVFEETLAENKNTLKKK